MTMLKPAEVAERVLDALITYDETGKAGELYRVARFTEEYLNELNIDCWEEDDECEGIIGKPRPDLVPFSDIPDLPAGSFLLDDEGDIWKKLSNGVWVMYELAVPNGQPHEEDFGPYHAIKVHSVAKEDQ